MNSKFSMNSEFGQTRLNEFKQIWQNLNFTNPNDQVLQKNSSQVTLEFDQVFFTYILLIFIFFWNFEAVNSIFDGF
jgi:hypothetical protein